jgi:hypothetical protein
VGIEMVMPLQPSLGFCIGNVTPCWLLHHSIDYEQKKSTILDWIKMEWSKGKKKIVCQNSQAKRGKKRGKKKKKGVIDTKSSSVSSLILPTSS